MQQCNKTVKINFAFVKIGLFATFEKTPAMITCSVKLCLDTALIFSQGNQYIMSERNLTQALPINWYALAVVQWMQRDNLTKYWVNDLDEYYDDLPNETKYSDFEYVLEYDYRTVNKIIANLESPVNLIFRTSTGNIETGKNALKLPVGYVLRDIDGVVVRRMADGNFKSNAFLILPEQFILSTLYQKIVTLFNSIFRNRKEKASYEIEEKANEIEEQSNDVEQKGLIISFPKDVETRNQILDVIASIIVSFDKEKTFNNPAVKNTDFAPSERDVLFEDAARLIVYTQKASTSLIQRKLKLGYIRAGRIIDQLEAVGVVGAFEGHKLRDVKVTNEIDLKQLFIDYELRTYNIYDEKISSVEEMSPMYLSEIYRFNSDNFATLSSNESVISKFYQENKSEIENKIFEIKQIEKDQLQRELDRKEKEVIKTKLLENERKRGLSLEAREELIEKGLLFNKYSNKQKSRETIPQEIMDQVWNRDGGKCVGCGSQESLEFDHIIPHSKGGAATYRNLQILCKTCNLKKSNKIG